MYPDLNYLEENLLIINIFMTVFQQNPKNNYH